MTSPVFVTALRNRDLASSYHGTLSAFRFHRNRIDVDWFCGEVRVEFPSWSQAQKAVNQLRAGDGRLWDGAAAGQFMTKPTTPKPATIGQLLDYWSENIPSKSCRLIDDSSCMSAQEQVLHFLGGFSLKQLRNICDQHDIDVEVAKLLGISTAHSVLLHMVDVRRAGSPACVIRNPEQVLGPQAQVILAFWRHLDQMDRVDWLAVVQAAAEIDAFVRLANQLKYQHRAPVAAMIWDLSVAVAAEQAQSSARVAGIAAAIAAFEIQGANVMRAKGRPFIFLPLFGFKNPESIPDVPWCASPQVPFHG